MADEGGKTAGDGPDRDALAQAVGAYFIWGFLPVYFNLIKAVSPLQVVAHRVIWSVLLLLGMLYFRKRLGALWEALTTRQMLLPMVATALLIGANWLIYIWAVTNGFVAASSLGYFLNPLLNVLLGFLFLKERLTPLQWVAVGLAGLGVAIMATGALDALGISLSLALTFGVYWLIRKVAPVGPMVGLAGETIILLPAALATFGWWWIAGTGQFGTLGLQTDALLIASGVVTALPLLLFASAARRMKYATIGLIQYIGPTIQFLLAIFLYREPLTTTHFVTFPLIWAGLVLYSWDAWRQARLQDQAPA
ncbi:MAG: EamA family transporter RarD [Sphingopyxis sp.]|nr:EamA family transporter RarD [Sphingopyxis sp.]